MPEVIFNEPQITPEERFKNAGREESSFAKWLYKKSGGKIKNEKQAGLVLVLASLVVIGLSVYIFLNVGV